jgi:hypothetical protein
MRSTSPQQLIQEAIVSGDHVHDPLVVEVVGLMPMTLVVEVCSGRMPNTIRGWHQCPNLSAHCNINSRESRPHILREVLYSVSITFGFG